MTVLVVSSIRDKHFKYGTFNVLNTTAIGDVLRASDSINRFGNAKSFS